MAKTLEYIINLKDGSFGKGMSKAKAETAGLDKAIGGLKRFIGAGVLIGIGRQVLDFADKTTDVKMQVEGLDNAIRFSNAQFGQKNIEYLDKTTETLGTNLMAAKEGFALLSAAAIGSKFSNEQVRDIYESTTKALTVMNRSTEDQKLALLALSQMMSKGKIQAEELRGQLGERIPGAVTIMARALGVSTSALNKMMDDGKLLSEDVLPKFAKELEKTFASGLPAAVNSTRAQMTRLENQTDKSMAKLGGQLEGVTKDWKMMKLQALEFLSDILPKTDAAQPLYAINAEMNKSFDTLRNLIPGTQEYNTLREKINQTYPSYLQNLLTEKDTLWDLKYAQEQANEAMRARRQQMIGDEKQKEIAEKREKAITKIAQLEREIAEREGRMALGDNAAWWETSHKNLIKQNKQMIDFWDATIKKLEDDAKKERTLTFKLRFEKDRKGLLEDAKTPQELSRALNGDNTGLPFGLQSLLLSNMKGLSILSGKNANDPANIASMIEVAKNKFGANINPETFGIKQDKKGNWSFDKTNANASAEGGLGSYNSTLSAGRSVRNVTVSIENLIREFNVHANTLKEGMGQVRNTVTDALNRAVLDAEAAL